MNGRVTALESRIDSLDAKIDSKIDALESKIDSKIDSRINALETKLIKWMIATMLTCIGTSIASAGLALALAKAFLGNKVP